MDLSERGDGSSRHPWEIERFRAYRRVLDDHQALDARRVLDVGAGDGWFSQTLMNDLLPDVEVCCWDVNYSDTELDDPDPRMTRTATRPTGQFDLALLLDVLEHIEEPERFIDEQLRPVLPPGTPVLVAVPAHPWLFGRHDVALGHYRRYRRRDLFDTLTPFLEVADHGPLFTSLLLPRTASVAAERVGARFHDPDGHDPTVDGTTDGVGAWTGGALITSVMCSVLAADARMTRFRPARRLPGLSSWIFGYVAEASS